MALRPRADDTPPALGAIEALARDAGAAVMAVYRQDFAVRSKGDASPVTAADEHAETILVAGLRALAPAIPIVAEEAASRGSVPVVGDRWWLVDPLDGTREFVDRNGEFTVNIALIEHGRPVLGVVYAPALGVLYSGVVGQGAWVENDAGDRMRREIRCRAVPAAGATVAGSRSHGDEAAMQRWLQGRRVAGRITAGSSLKFGLLAAGTADVYPRFGRTMEWDTAAGDAVLRAAGGRVTTLAGDDLRYGKPGHENPHFVAWGCPWASR